MKSSFALTLGFLLLLAVQGFAQPSEEKPWVVYEGQNSPGNGKHIVFVSGDEEYRSEEALPMLAKVLAVRHGFKATVLFPIDPATGEINPDYQKNIPGLQALEDADMMVLFTRFRQLPKEQMQYIIDYIDSGKPIMGLRTSTHAFQYKDKNSPFAKYSWNSKVDGWEGGFGRQVFGETWVNHHGNHGHESTRGLINGLYKDHPILNGVKDIWVPSDVYGISGIHGGGEVLVHGQSLSGMKPSAAPNNEKSLMPLAWKKTFTGPSGKTSRVFAATIGAAIDLKNEDLRRLLVNACYWGMEMEDEIPEKANVAYVDEYDPTFFGFGDYQKGLTPKDFVLQNP